MQSHLFRNNLKLSYYLDDFTDPWGEPETIVLIHAAMGNADRFYSWVPFLSREYRVVRPDIRGYGHSDLPPPDEPVSLEVLVDDVVALLDHLKCEKVHIVGNSSGGFIGQRLAMTHPDRMHTLAVFSSGPGLRQTNAAGWIPQIQKEGLRPFLARTVADRLPPHLIGTRQAEHFLDDLGRCDPGYVGKYVSHMASREWTDELHRISCPTLVVAPGGGTIHSLSEYQAMKQRIPLSEVLIYDDAPHSICEHMTEQCIVDLKSFLRRHPVNLAADKSPAS